MGHIVIQCTPIRPHGMVSARWSRCVGSVLGENCLGRTTLYRQDDEGNQIAEMRNWIVEDGLAYEQSLGGDHVSFFWIDDDVLVYEGSLLELLHTDWNGKPCDIVSGVYFTKMAGNLAAPLVYPVKSGGPDRFRPNQIYPVWGHGMGLALIRSEVYKRMRDVLPLGKDKYGRPRWYHTGQLDDIHVDPRGVIGTGDTEDMHFLQNAQKLGFQPVINTYRHAFGWHYDAKTQMGYPEKQWSAYLKGQEITWQTPDGVVTWD
jgi:hypothetical protein